MDGAFGEAQGELVQLFIDQPSMDFQLIAQGRCVASPYSGVDSHQLHFSSDKFTTKALASSSI